MKLFSVSGEALPQSIVCITETLISLLDQKRALQHGTETTNSLYTCQSFFNHLSVFLSVFCPRLLFCVFYPHVHSGS